MAVLVTNEEFAQWHAVLWIRFGRLFAPGPDGTFLIKGDRLRQTIGKTEMLATEALVCDHVENQRQAVHDLDTMLFQTFSGVVFEGLRVGAVLKVGQEHRMHGDFRAIVLLRRFGAHLVGVHKLFGRGHRRVATPKRSILDHGVQPSARPTVAQSAQAVFLEHAFAGTALRTLPVTLRGGQSGSNRWR